MYSVSTGKVKQVGQGQRKSGPYGGCFGLHEIDPHKAFVARPGFRIWSTNETSEVCFNVLMLPRKELALFLISSLIILIIRCTCA